MSHVIRSYADQQHATAVAKRAVFLAWRASHVGGMGFLQDRGPGMSEDDVWAQTTGPGDYAVAVGDDSYINADYVFGRMVKLRFRRDGCDLSYWDVLLRIDYQSWCTEYPSMGALFVAAERDVGVFPVTVDVEVQL